MESDECMKLLKTVDRMKSELEKLYTPDESLLDGGV
jgi:hypothetical protein